MSISLGSTNFGSIYLGSTKIGEAYLGNVKVYGSTPVDPLNPLGLPPYTIRLKFSSGVTPTFFYGTAVQVSSSPDNVWDLTYNSNYWGGVLSYQTDLIAVLGANTTGVIEFYNAFAVCSNLQSVALFDTSSATNITSMFQSCSSLTSIPLFDTSSVTTMRSMFHGCTSLTSVPTFNTPSVTDMSYMFQGCPALTSIPLLDTSSVTDMRYMCSLCTAVETGALALYQQASSQTTPPSQFGYCFYLCGSNTVTGAAELALIPKTWGGTANEYQSDYYLMITAASYDQIAFCDLYVNGSSQTITSAEVNDGGWSSIPTTDINYINNGGKYKVYGDGLRIYFTSTSGDVLSLSYYASKSDSDIASTVCIPDLYAKKVGSDTWTLVKRGNTYIQDNDKQVSISI